MGAWWVGLQKGCQTLPSLQNRNEEWKARLDMSRGKKAILETSKTANYLLIAPNNGANATTKAALREKQPRVGKHLFVGACTCMRMHHNTFATLY